MSVETAHTDSELGGRSAGSTSNAQLRAADQQDIRLAVVLNGGVSLAIWIGGVAAELHRLVQASRAPGDVRHHDAYAGLLDVLHARARVDVIAGTSAGGLNGGFLSLGIAHGCDLDAMRALWADEGGLETLLRDPRTKDAPSLLRGEYFHQALARAYASIAARPTGRPAPDGEFVELYLTGTLWKGRRSPFTDEMGRRIVEVNHDATFQFSSDPAVVDGAPAGDLRDTASVVPELAAASRCTSSFPAAFEPWWVTVSEPFGGRWKSSAGLANFGESQYVVDGGVLLNKPIRPALDAVYRQSASWQIRRVMAYIVPDPGEAPPTGDATTERPKTPGASEVALGVMTRLRATGSVAAELAEIDRHNDDSRRRRATRDRLASSLLEVDVPALATATYPAYREVRNESAARTIASLLVRGGGEHGWSARELRTEILSLAGTDDGLPFVPPKSLHEALDAPPGAWRWGQSEVERLGDLVVDVFKRAVWLAPLHSDTRVAIVEQRAQLHEAMAVIRGNSASLDRFWTGVGSTLPKRGGRDAATPAQLAELRVRLAAALDQWEQGRAEAGRVALHRQALDLARRLYDARASLGAVSQLQHTAVDPGADERSQLAALVRVLLGATSDPADVLRNMLRLQVVFVAFAGAAADIEQEVELVQLSSATPQWLTGVQEHHFGAFYRASWRVNDWLRGRIDGATQLVQMLLAPERLRQLGMSSRDAYTALREVAVGPASDPLAADLAAAWDQQAEPLQAELAVLDGQEPLPRVFPLVSARIAERLQAAVLPDELRALADAVRSEPDPLTESSRWAAQAARTLGQERVTLSDIRNLIGGAGPIGRQRIRAEAARTDTFARTASHGFAAATAMAGVRHPRVVGATMSAIRGYALLVWVLVNGLTERSRFGVNAVTLALGVGGALLGVTLVVPSVPVLVPLIGAVLVLGAASATALTRRSRYGRFGWRLLVPVALAVAALLGDLWWTLSGTDSEDLRTTLADGITRILVVVVVVLLGWFVARARPVPDSGDPADPAVADGGGGLGDLDQRA